jgi:hypothetical protein
MLQPAAASISLSASIKGTFSFAATLRPTADFPAPISPTSTSGFGNVIGGESSMRSVPACSRLLAVAVRLSDNYTVAELP